MSGGANPPGPTISFKLKAVEDYIVGWAGAELEILSMFDLASDVESTGKITARERSADAYLDRINSALGRSYSGYTLTKHGFSVNDIIPDFENYQEIP